MLFREPLLNRRLTFSVQEFIRNNADKGALHKGTTLADPNELFPRNGECELQKTAVKVRITDFA